MNDEINACPLENYDNSTLLRSQQLIDELGSDEYLDEFAKRYKEVLGYEVADAKSATVGASTKEERAHVIAEMIFNWYNEVFTPGKRLQDLGNEQ